MTKRAGPCANRHAQVRKTFGSWRMGQLDAEVVPTSVSAACMSHYVLFHLQLSSLIDITALRAAGIRFKYVTPG